MVKSSRKKKVAKPAKDDSKKIKVRLDNRTVITIRNIAMFKIWKEKYPKAEIIV